MEANFSVRNVPHNALEVTFHNGHVVTYHGIGADYRANKEIAESIGRYYGLCKCGRYEWQDVRYTVIDKEICLQVKCQRDRPTRPGTWATISRIPHYVTAI